MAGEWLWLCACEVVAAGLLAATLAACLLGEAAAGADASTIDLTAAGVKAACWLLAQGLEGSRLIAADVLAGQVAANTSLPDACTLHTKHEHRDKQKQGLIGYRDNGKLFLPLSSKHAGCPAGNAAAMGL